jgi:hypothetical protein
VDGKVGRYCVEGVFKELMGLLLIARSQIQRDPFMLKEFGNRLQKPVASASMSLESSVLNH